MDNEILKMCFDDLTYAVVRQAIKDYYKSCYPRVNDPPKYRPMSDEEYRRWLNKVERDRKVRLKELEEFFRSDFYRMRMSLNGDELMDSIRIRRRHQLPLFGRNLEDE